jgi:hypothetical protein
VAAADISGFTGHLGWHGSRPRRHVNFRISREAGFDTIPFTSYAVIDTGSSPVVQAVTAYYENSQVTDSVVLGMAYSATSKISVSASLIYTKAKLFTRELRWPAPRRSGRLRTHEQGRAHRCQLRRSTEAGAPRAPSPHEARGRHRPASALRALLVQRHRRMFGARSPSADVPSHPVGYTPEWTRRAIAFCELTFGKLPLRHRVLVLNRARHRSRRGDGWEVVRGSNTLGEFSGWQEGLARLSDLGEQDAVVFVNDTVGAYQHMSIFRRWCLAREIRSMSANRMVGFTQDSTGLHGALTVRGLPAYPFVPTFCFALPYQVLVKLELRSVEPRGSGVLRHGGTDKDRFSRKTCRPRCESI